MILIFSIRNSQIVDFWQINHLKFNKLIQNVKAIYQIKYNIVLGLLQSWPQGRLRAQNYLELFWKLRFACILHEKTKNCNTRKLLLCKYVPSWENHSGSKSSDAWCIPSFGEYLQMYVGDDELDLDRVSLTNKMVAGT